MANLHKIRELCEEKKLSIRELSKRVGKDESTIQALIRNGSTNTMTLEIIAKELNVHPGIFFDNYNPSGINQNGNGNINAIGNKITIAAFENELKIARKEIESLEAILKEKERLIQILMNKIK